MKAQGIDFTGIAYLAALGLGAFLVYRVATKGPAAVGQAVDAVKNAVSDAVDAVTPTNPNNIFNRAFQPIADLFIGSDPDKKSDGQKLLSQFTTFDQEDADQGAAGRALTRRPDLLMQAPDVDDAEQGARLAAENGMPFIDYSKLSRGVFH